ncbi:hypothetical protein NEUTE1DRAFT_66152 [Neurospora tetrasperma FGSC 2508]|uniref:Uncharacterized protein n=2 Tax=Neurospora TaxID=5140 RepID=A0AAJ0I4M4_9PEZI|nr:uncharacterized protein NEUTE1DRAFT_66152 [Neurospora tetrasperma FGSC 2508]EGO57131.1 hypothetical protein NEUTE1DRAFT_66152 [Neurospora tetrasperma FGSC 2508]EGZ69950.1 hypothetical protein NEUTE2DRAFT_112364 [Neurospora tetrasperma FGSC 2509]KAK3490190.1 hypothetical protein B0T23DRAFT_413024 [Neurospora hispaniola]
MPRQYVLFGRPLPRLGSRHLSLLLVSVSLFAIFSLLFTLPSAIPTGPSLQIADHKLSIPDSIKNPWNKVNPFKQPAHAPPRQKNDTYGQSSWYANWKWLSYPFSSSVTLDESRSLLPELAQRPPIYVYYDNTIEREKATKEVESDILLSWRRAWWAQGFKPIILSPAEAMNNPMYEELQHRSEGMDASLKTDMMRWLAWENMGGGLLAHYFLFPMGAYDDPLLVYLRRGEFPGLTRWKDLGDGLFVGPKADVAKAIKLALASPNLKTAKNFLEATSASKEAGPFTIDDTEPSSLAFYSASALKLYPKVAETIGGDRVAGLKSLNELINAHLHQTWQSLFSEGIAVVKPLPQHTTHMIAPSYSVALRLASCPANNPLPSSCPPNRPKCVPCSTTSHPIKISTPAHYKNSSALYTIGTVPHPYTIQSLSSMREQITVPWIRRESVRDAWVGDLMTDLFKGKAVPAGARVLRFKEAVAGEYGSARSLWLTAERDDTPEGILDWHFGFDLPALPASSPKDKAKEEGEHKHDDATEKIESEIHKPKDNFILPPLHDEKEGPVPTEQDLKLEPNLLSIAKTIVSSAASDDGEGAADNKNKKIHVTKEEIKIREAVEAWNLADWEAWRFARAYLARKEMEREKWAEEEEKYAGGMGSERKRGKSGGWFDSD